jgi:hypothetical protein
LIFHKTAPGTSADGSSIHPDNGAAAFACDNEHHEDEE